MSAAAAAKLLPGTAGRFKDIMPLLMSSMPGALFSGGFTTLTTGNPLAGLTVAGADLLGSTALASGIGALGGKTGTRKIFGKDVRLAGGKVTKLRPDDVIPKEARTSKEAFEKFMQRRTSFEPSPAQTVGQISGSIGAVLAVEPMFYPKDQGSIISQQLNQRLGFDALSTNLSGNPMTVQGSSTDPKLVHGSIKKSDTEYPGGGYATGTLYQIAGTPMRGM